jgi:hypothetical protein
MAGRSLKGQLAFVSTGLLSILNLLATIGGIAGIVIICALEHAPSSVGWLLIVVGGFTVASGLIGIFTSNRRGCFTWQAVLLMFALVGLISASLVIFFKPTLVLQRMNLKISESSARKIMKFQAAIFFIVFCIDVSVLSIVAMQQYSLLYTSLSFNFTQFKTCSDSFAIMLLQPKSLVGEVLVLV